MPQTDLFFVAIPVFTESLDGIPAGVYIYSGVYVRGSGIQHHVPVFQHLFELDAFIFLPHDVVGKK